MGISLRNRFFNLLEPYANGEQIVTFWDEIEKKHSESGRVYHNLTHLENLFLELEAIRADISNWETVSFSVFYHDIIYNVRKKDNEEQSAVLAIKRLESTAYPQEEIKIIETQIIATKSHTVSKNADTNLFTDADLSILGKPWETYQQYFNAIRKEYRIYPNLLYNPARKKVLIHFLKMPSLFKTPHFKGLYEKQARENITRELELI